MDWIEDFTQFEKGNYKPDINKWEIYLKGRFNIQYQFKANNLLPDPLILIQDFKRKEFLLEKYSPNNYSIILPKSGIEINCTKNFIETIPLMDNIFSGKWAEKAYQIQYYNKELKKILNGPHIYISYTDLEAFVYENIPKEISEENDNNKYYNEENLLKSIKKCLKYCNMF